MKDKLIKKRRLKKIWQCYRYTVNKERFEAVANELKEVINEPDYSVKEASRRISTKPKPIPSIRTQDGSNPIDLEKAKMFALTLYSKFSIHGHHRPLLEEKALNPKSTRVGPHQATTKKKNTTYINT